MTEPQTPATEAHPMMRCPFCVFTRTLTHNTESAVQALRELAVHIVFAHPDNFDELAQHVSDEWAGRFPR